MCVYVCVCVCAGLGMLAHPLAFLYKLAVNVCGIAVHVHVAG